MSETPAPAAILQQLIRFDTTNPPGSEAACIQYVDGLLTGAGIETRLLALDPARPNLIARLPGRGDAAPLLVYGHVDVVTTEDQPWTRPPFGGEIADGLIWGRGAVDMKGPVAMMISAVLRAAAEGADLPGDVILAVLADEEAHGTYGAKFLVEQHPEQFDGVRHAIGEFGGFTMYMAGRRLYPIMIGEKQTCWLTATVRGQGGHASVPVRGGAMARLADVLRALDRRRLPVHVTPSVRLMIEAFAAALPFPQSVVMRSLLNPALTNRIIPALGEQGRLLDALLRNTATPTMIRAGHLTNVIPAEIALTLDGRLLPGQHPDDMLRELRVLLGPDVELTLNAYDPGPSSVDMSFFDGLADILREIDPEGIPVPYVLAAVTDARFFARLGIQTYGFTPMQLAPGFDFAAAVHAADERIPVEAVSFGADAIFRALRSPARTAV